MDARASDIGTGMAVGVAAGAVGTVALALRSPTYGHQVRYLLRDAHRPWLAPEAYLSSRAAHSVSTRLYGAGAHIDDTGDALRHAFGAARLVQRATGRWRMPPDRAARLVRDAGLAHELDGIDNPLGAVSRAMDLHNNDVGIRIGISSLGGRATAH